MINELLEYGGGLFLIIGVMFSFLVGAIVMIVFTRVELNYVKNSYGAFLDYLGGGESRDIFRELTSTLRSIEHENRVRDKDMTYLFNLLSNCVQKVGIVRYNAFHNIGSDQSFSVALLDSEDNGIVMSSIYGRDSSTTYAKPIRYGASDYVLTEEEMDAIGIARKYFIDKSYFNRR